MEVNIAATGLPVFDEANCGFPTTVAPCPDSRPLQGKCLSRVDKMSFSKPAVQNSDSCHTPLCTPGSLPQPLQPLTRAWGNQLPP